MRLASRRSHSRPLPEALIQQGLVGDLTLLGWGAANIGSHVFTLHSIRSNHESNLIIQASEERVLTALFQWARPLIFLLQVLIVLELEEDFFALAENDPLGRKLQDVRLVEKRSRAPRKTSYR